LVDVLKTQIRNQLTTDKTQNEGDATVTLSTWVVQGTSSTSTPSFTNDRPVATDQPLTIQLIRRIDLMQRQLGSGSTTTASPVTAPAAAPSSPTSPASTPSNGNEIEPIPSGSSSRNNGFEIQIQPIIQPIGNSLRTDGLKTGLEVRRAGLDSSRRSCR